MGVLWLFCCHGVAMLSLLMAFFPSGAAVALAIALGVAMGIYWLTVQILPGRFPEPVELRLKVMAGGRRLIHWSFWGWVALWPVTALFLWIFRGRGLSLAPVWWDLGVSAVLTLLTMLCGGIRVLCTCRRLNVGRRIFVACCLWIPVVNLLALLYAARIAGQEYDHECYKAPERWVRGETQACRTQYPLVLVHGVGFRDLRYFNYWGRIPRELTRAGATVYYGNQEAWGTIEANAQDIKERILDILEETGCRKVNIIAHSKGGLDARYMISALGMGDKVASLTTISTPHRGCRFVDILSRMPDGVYRWIAGLMDRNFRKLGDTHPDFYAASHQFRTDFAAKFNEEVRDDPRVYYQSYASVMKNCLSDWILTIPYLMIRAVDGESDGLVTVPSAQWGDFQGVFRSKYRRGVSHGDIIDLHREDYRGFDVVETHAAMVSRLKRLGL